MRKALRIFTIAYVLLCCTACNNSYESLVDQFNRKYFMPEQNNPEGYSVKNENFNPVEMLNPVYSITEGVYLDLEAPEGGDSYSWELIQDDGTPLQPPLSTERILYYKTPGVFVLREENDLVLTVTVTDKEGNVTEYIDKTVIIIKSQKGF